MSSLIFLVSVLLMTINSHHLIWALLSLELMNLGILNLMVSYFPGSWFMFLLIVQVSESILLMSFLLLNLKSWSVSMSLSQ